MQGFLRSENDYILKELAIIPLQGVDPVVFLFKNPFSWKKLSTEYQAINTWIKYNYHGISWSSGDRPYTSVVEILREHLYKATKVYVIGSIRKSWLERFKFNVYDVTEMGYSPSIKIKLATVCPHHNNGSNAQCALHNIRRVKRFLQS